VGARFTPGVPRGLRRLALGTFLGTLAQAPLGAITVYAGLNPWLVMSHFMLALVVLAGGVVLAVEAISFEHGRSATRLPQTIRRGALVAAAALLALVATGTVSTAAGPHPGSVDVERLWRLHAALYVHVRATAIFGALFLAFLVYIFRNRERWPLYAEGAASCSSCSLVQMGVGELQYRTHLPWWLVLVHVALAARSGRARRARRRHRAAAEAVRATHLHCLDGRRAEDLRAADLRGPILICAFRGWNDGGQGASLAADFLAQSWKAERSRTSIRRSSSTSR
jgi:heme A synthase